MYFAVVIVQRPQGQIAQVQGAWPAFANEVAQLKLPAGKSQRLSDNRDTRAVPLVTYLLINATRQLGVSSWK